MRTPFKVLLLGALVASAAAAGSLWHAALSSSPSRVVVQYAAPAGGHVRIVVSAPASARHPAKRAQRRARAHRAQALVSFLRAPVVAARSTVAPRLAVTRPSPATPQRPGRPQAPEPRPTPAPPRPAPPPEQSPPATAPVAAASATPARSSSEPRPTGKPSGSGSDAADRHNGKDRHGHDRHDSGGSSQPPTQPGRGNGDDNHDHSGPPGKKR